MSGDVGNTTGYALSEKENTSCILHIVSQDSHFHFEKYALFIYIHVDLKYDYVNFYNFVLLPLSSGFEKLWFNFALAAVLLGKMTFESTALIEA